MKGKRFQPAAGVRPTTAKIREALISILRGRFVDFEGITVLDAFAGTGQVGWDCFAEGAEKVVFIEIDATQANALRGQARRQGGARVTVLCGEAVALLRRIPGSFRVIYLDPPYGSPAMRDALRLVGERGVLAVDGVLVAEHHHKDDVPDAVPGLVRRRLERYGETALSFFEVTPHEETGG